jgi:hypothetical protein
VSNAAALAGELEDGHPIVWPSNGKFETDEVTNDETNGLRQRNVNKWGREAGEHLEERATDSGRRM